MNFKLYTQEKFNSPIEKVLKSRGIEDVEKWLNASMDDVAHWSLLSNLQNAVEKVQEHIEKHNRICIIVDSDVDGFSSASILMNYLYKINPNLDIDFILHTGKQHGFCDLMDNLKTNNYSLIISPDGGTNDYDQLDELGDIGIDVVILD